MASRRSWIILRRSPPRNPAGGRMTPAATCAGWLAPPSITPNPVTTLPGSIPSTRPVTPIAPTSPRDLFIGEAENLGRRELRELFVADVEVGGDALDLFVILELLHQLEHLLGGMAGNPHRVLGNPDHLGAGDRNLGRL